MIAFATGRLGAFLAVVALAVGGVAGWFAAGAWSKCENVEVCKCANVETANDGRARSPSAPNGRARRPATADSKPRRKALIRSSADAEVQKRILENKIIYLEKCIAAAKELSSKPDGSGASTDGRAGSPLPAGNKRETKAEIIERLMKLPTDTERYFAFTRLDEKTQMSLTIGELKKLCPRQMTIDEELAEKLAERLDKMTEVNARRIGILEAFNPSGLNDEERKVHAEFMDFLAECPDVFAKMIDQRDSMTWGEVNGRIKRMISTYKRGAELVKKEQGMLITQVVESFEIPDGDALELRATLDDVWDATSSGYFEKKD